MRASLLTRLLFPSIPTFRTEGYPMSNELEVHHPAGHKQDVKQPLPKVQDHAEAVASCLIETVLGGTRVKKIRPEPPRGMPGAPWKVADPL